MSSARRKPTHGEDDEVEQMLQAAQDGVLLRLNVDSHMAHASTSDAIDADLERRFQALKRSPNPPQAAVSTKIVRAAVDSGSKKLDGAAAEDDLFTRFAALKKPSSCDQSGSTCPGGPDKQPDTEEDSEDEVEKLIKWAIDAARLDPSPPSDSDDTDDDEFCSTKGQNGQKKIIRKP